MTTAHLTAKQLLTESVRRLIAEDTFTAVAAAQVAIDLLTAEGTFRKAEQSLRDCEYRAADYLQHIRRTK